MNNGDALAPLRGIPGLGSYLAASPNFATQQWASGGNQEMEHLKRLVIQQTSFCNMSMLHLAGGMQSEKLLCQSVSIPADL